MIWETLKEKADFDKFTSAHNATSSSYASQATWPETGPCFLQKPAGVAGVARWQGATGWHVRLSSNGRNRSAG